MAKQIEANGKAVGQLTLNQRHGRDVLPTSPTSSEATVDDGFLPPRQSNISQVACTGYSQQGCSEGSSSTSQCHAQNEFPTF